MKQKQGRPYPWPNRIEYLGSPSPSRMGFIYSPNSLVLLWRSEIGEREREADGELPWRRRRILKNRTRIALSFGMRRRSCTSTPGILSLLPIQRFLRVTIPACMRTLDEHAIARLGAKILSGFPGSVSKLATYFVFSALACSSALSLITFRDELIWLSNWSSRLQRESNWRRELILHLHGCFSWPHNERTVPKVHIVALGVYFCLYESVSTRFLCSGVIIGCIPKKGMTLSPSIRAR